MPHDPHLAERMRVVWVKADQAAGRDLVSWIALAEKFVSTLPPK
jgi:hypothetical protein